MSPRKTRSKSAAEKQTEKPAPGSGSGSSSGPASGPASVPSSGPAAISTTSVTAAAGPASAAAPAPVTTSAATATAATVPASAVASRRVTRSRVTRSGFNRSRVIRSRFIRSRFIRSRFVPYRIIRSRVTRSANSTTAAAGPAPAAASPPVTRPATTAAAAVAPPSDVTYHRATRAATAAGVDFGSIDTSTNGAPEIYHCDIEDCNFTSHNETGIPEHKKNQHIGTKCYFLLGPGRECGYTGTHKEVLKHFNAVHQPRNPNAEAPFMCQWKDFDAQGNPLPCGKSFAIRGSTERHCRKHQYDEWMKKN